MASDIMKIMNTKDLRRGAEQLKYTPSDKMVEICAEMGSATPEELASMCSRAGQVPWTNERPLENKELNAIIGAWFTLWRD
ncbi:hypothetical protein Tco_0175103 [Tanacetum coccineum]